MSHLSCLKLLNILYTKTCSMSTQTEKYRKLLHIALIWSEKILSFGQINVKSCFILKSSNSFLPQCCKEMIFHNLQEAVHVLCACFQPQYNVKNLLLHNFAVQDFSPEYFVYPNQFPLQEVFPKKGPKVYVYLYKICVFYCKPE